MDSIKGYNLVDRYGILKLMANPEPDQEQINVQMTSKDNHDCQDKIIKHSLMVVFSKLLKLVRD